MLRKKPGKADEEKKAPVAPVPANKPIAVPPKPVAPVNPPKIEPKKDPLDVYKFTRTNMS